MSHYDLPALTLGIALLLIAFFLLGYLLGTQSQRQAKALLHDLEEIKPLFPQYEMHILIAQQCHECQQQQEEQVS